MPGRAQRWYSVESSISVRPHRTPPALESLAHFCRPGVSTWRRPTCPRGPSAPAPTTGRFSWRTWPARACPTLHAASIGSTSRRSSRPSLSAPHPRLPRRRYRSLQQLSGWLDEEGEIDGSPMGQDAPAQDPREAGPGSARRGRAAAAGGLFRQGLPRPAGPGDHPAGPGHRNALEGMAGLRHSPGDPEASDVDLRLRVVRITTHCEGTARDGPADRPQGRPGHRPVRPRARRSPAGGPTRGRG